MPPTIGPGAPLVQKTAHRDPRAFGSAAEQVELCATVGLSAIVNRFHATFRTDVDETTVAGAGDVSFCPIGR